MKLFSSGEILSSASKFGDGYVFMFSDCDRNTLEGVHFDVSKVPITHAIEDNVLTWS